MPDIGTPHPVTTDTNVFTGTDGKADVGEPNDLGAGIGIPHPPGDVGIPHPPGDVGEPVQPQPSGALLTEGGIALLTEAGAYVLEES